MLFITKVAIDKKPKAIAIVLGHLGVTKSQLESYASFYTKYQCHTIASASPPIRFVLNQNLKETCYDIIKSIIYALQQYDNYKMNNNNNNNAIATTSSSSVPLSLPSKLICNDEEKTTCCLPIIIHSMSNGGAFLLEEIEKILIADCEQQQQDQDTTITEVDSNGNNMNLSLSKEDRMIILDRIRLGVQIFDSCPCYIRTVWKQESTINSSYEHSFPYHNWSILFRKAYTMIATMSLSLWCTTTLSMNRPNEFWNHMLHSQLCHHQMYIYTTADVLSDSYAVEQLIHYRKNILNIPDIITYKFEDSGHCQLHNDHKDIYDQMIHDAVDSSIQRANSNN